MRRTAIHFGVLMAAAGAAILFLTQYAPFVFPSYLFYAGAIVALAALASLVYPLRFLLIRSRKAAALTLLGGLAAMAIAMVWPFHRMHSGAHTALDRVMPDYHFNEVHSMRIAAPRETALRAMQEVTGEEITLARTLFVIRALAMGQRPHITGMDRPLTGSGFFKKLAEEPGREVVFGGQVQDGRVKLAFNIRVEDEGGGWTRIWTETRILGTDDDAMRSFSRYWCMVYPGSAILRRTWLEAAAARIERER